MSPSATTVAIHGISLPQAAHGIPSGKRQPLSIVQDSPNHATNVFRATWRSTQSWTSKGCAKRLEKMEVRAYLFEWQADCRRDDCDD